MTDTIDLLLVGPTQLSVGRVPADYREFNRLVGGPTGPGSISMLRLPSELQAEGFAAYCDDDAIAREQVPNRWAEHLGHWRLQGPVVIFRDDGMGNEATLSPEDVRFLANYLAHGPTTEAVLSALDNMAFWQAHPSGHAVYELNDDLTIGREIPLPGND